MKAATIERNRRRLARPSLRECAIVLVRRALEYDETDARRLLRAARFLIAEAQRRAL